jgi:hypothetical protein
MSTREKKREAMRESLAKKHTRKTRRLASRKRRLARLHRWAAGATAALQAEGLLGDLSGF